MTLLKSLFISFIFCAGPLFIQAHPSGGPDFREVDEHALRAPASVTKSVRALSKWLTEPFHSDEEKTRAIFRWITQNISYDVDAFFSGRIMSGRGEDALKSKRGVCEGYSGLFDQLARAAGIEVVKISGYAKGYGYEAGGSIGTKPNHAWNAVRINGAWKLLDCTWGAGYIGEDRRFHRDFNPHYFFTPPEDFIFDHLPEQQSWQLLARPRTKAEYERLVYLRPKFFSLGLERPEEDTGTIRADAEVVLRLGSTRRILGMATLLKNEKTLDEHQTFVQQEGNDLVIRAMPFERGDHILRLFAKSPGEPGDYAWVLDYHIEFSGHPDRSAGYPRMFAAFQENRVLLTEPLTGTLKSESIQHFRLTLPSAEQAAVIVGKKWTFLRRNKVDFEGDVAITPGDVGVYAKYPGHKDFDALLEYTGE